MWRSDNQSVKKRTRKNKASNKVIAQNGNLKIQGSDNQSREKN